MLYKVQGYRRYFLRAGLVGLLTAFLSGFHPSSVCAEAKDIGFIDVQRVVSESIIGKAARTNVETEMKKKQSALGQSKEELDRLAADLEKQRSLLSENALDERKGALERKQREFQRMYQDSRDEIGKVNDREISRVVKEIDQIVSELASQGKYRVIFERDARSVVYANKDLDLTDQIIKTLDERKTKL